MNRNSIIKIRIFINIHEDRTAKLRCCKRELSVVLFMEGGVLEKKKIGGNIFQDSDDGA